MDETEFETKEMVPNRKFVPWLMTMETTNVRHSTGISPKDSLVNRRTPTTTKATRTMILLISVSMISAL